MLFNVRHVLQFLNLSSIVSTHSSVQKGVPPPPSLVNMYKELEKDIEGFVKPNHGYLGGWAEQGVLLLNACLTVRKSEANSHKDKGESY